MMSRHHHAGQRRPFQAGAAAAPASRAAAVAHSISSPVSSHEHVLQVGRAAHALAAPRRRASRRAQDATAGPVRRVAQPLAGGLRARPRPAAPAGRRPRAPARRRARAPARRRARRRRPCRATSPRPCRPAARPPRCSAWTSAPSRPRAQPVDQRPQLLAHLRVEADGRLVQQHQPRLVDQRRGRSAGAGACRRTACPRCVSRAVAEVGDVQRPLDRRARARRAARGRAARTRVRICSHGQLDVEVVELRHHAHLRARLLRLAAAAGSRAPRSRPRRRSPARSASASSSTCRRRWARAGRSRCRSGTSRSRPSTAVIAPKRLTTPRRRTAGDCSGTMP